MTADVEVSAEERAALAEIDAHEVAPEITPGSNVAAVIAAVAAALPPIPKGDYNTEQKFAYRGIERVLAKAGPALSKAGVLVVPHVTHRETETMLRGQNRNEWRLVILSVTYRLYGPAGDSIDAEVQGEGLDNADKATSKAMTMAQKSMLLQVLNIADADADGDRAQDIPEPSGPQRAQRQQNGGRASGVTKKAGPKAAPRTAEEIVRPLADKFGAEHAARVLTVLNRLNGIEPKTERTQVKQSFVATFGEPGKLKPQQMEDVADFLIAFVDVPEGHDPVEPDPPAEAAPEKAAGSPQSDPGSDPPTEGAGAPEAATEAPIVTDPVAVDPAVCQVCGDPSPEGNGFCEPHGPF